MPADPLLLVRTAGTCDIPALAEAITPAVLAMPLAVAAQPDPQIRHRAIRARLQALLAPHAAAATVRLAETGGQPVGCLAWSTCDPDNPPPAGLVTTLLDAADDGHRSRTVRAELARRHPLAAHQHLLLLAVRRDRQRHSIAAMLLDDWHRRAGSGPRFLLAPTRLADPLRRYGYRSTATPMMPAVGAGAWQALWAATSTPSEPTARPEAVFGVPLQPLSPHTLQPVE